MVVESKVTASDGSSDFTAPPGKTLTPFGLVDKACVHEIPSGAVLERLGHVTHDGAVIAHHNACSTDPRDRSKNAQAPTINGCTEWSSANATLIAGLAQYNGMFAHWTVPPSVPYSGWRYNGVLYFFPSFQSTSGEIIQPVLQFGDDGNNGGSLTGF